MGAIAGIYTLVKTPEILYNGKVSAHKKGKDMDVYIKTNALQKDLYEEMNNKALSANNEEKKVLSQQYFKLNAAQGSPPNFSQNV